MSIGYSALNSNLTITGEALVSPSPGIRITNIVLKEKTNSGYETYSSSYTNNSSTMFVTLPNLNSTVTYLIEVTNVGDTYYHLDLITETLVSNDNIGYEIIDKEAQYFLEDSVTQLEIQFFHKNTIVIDTDFSLGLEYLFSEVHYRKLDYIKYTGVQWLDTGIINTGDYEFELDFMIEGYNEDAPPVGSWIISGRKRYSYSVGVFLSPASIYVGYGGPTTSTSKPKTEGIWHDLFFLELI